MLENPRNKSFLLVAIASVLAACGGGGGGGGGAFVPPPPPTSDWQPGVFKASTVYESICRAPRTGINPATNQPYPDVRGSTTDENNFLRSYSNNTYLWYDEISDQDPGRYTDPLLYFDQLKTFAATSSGQPKDRFHFTYDSEDWYQLSQAGVSAGFGAQFILLSATPPREVIVADVEPGSPAAAAGINLARGAKILAIDGVDIDSNTQAGVDTLNAGLFPSGPGETHTFRVLDFGAAFWRDVTIRSAVITSVPVRETGVFVQSNGDRVGYMLFNDHHATAEQALIDAVDQFNSGQGIDDLVLDLRYNGGGFLAIASELAYMIAGPVATANRTFELLQFNDKHTSVNPITGRAISSTPFYSNALGPPFNAPEGQPLPTLDLPRVFVLTGAGTCSASEAVMNGLRGIDVEVIQIGSTTCGKPYGFYPVDNCGTTYFTIQFRGVNDRNFGSYTDGFSPANTQSNVGTVVTGCSVADDFSAALGDPNEDRFAAALRYRDTANCPTATALASGALGKAATSVDASEGLLLKSPWQMNRIMLPWQPE